MVPNLELVIGIEIHLELNTKTKLFSAAINDFNSAPNTNVSVIDLGYPGTLPTVNKQAVKNAIKLAKALKMEIDYELHFDRKHYFYTDIPKCFQITQQFRPIGKNGILELKLNNGDVKKIRINRIHIEEDTARQIHENNKTFINYNRAGVPLIEIVSEPDIRSIEEAIKYVELIRKTALFLNISDAKMSEGSLRADINFSLRSLGSDQYGTKVEIKNINSLNNIKKAIENEILLQTKQLFNNEQILQQTKRFDEKTLTNIVMREKSNVIDYKYLPEPNIPPILLDENWVQKIGIEALPWEVEEKYIDQGIPFNFVELLINNLTYRKLFDAIEYDNKSTLAKLFFSEVINLEKKYNKNLSEININPKDIKRLIELMDEGIISGKHFKEIVPKLVNFDQDLDLFIKENGYELISDEETLRGIILPIIDTSPELKKEFLERPERCVKFILGELMKQTQGKANPVVASKLTSLLLRD